MPRVKEKDNTVYIFENIDDIENQLNIIMNRFNMETDEYLIDSYIYQIQSLNKRYQYFIKQAKRLGLKSECFKRKGGGILCSRPL